tara:strand:+ start:216 stop:749 length:534 start_codon:yes stop_codon:yes gene_type:complete
LKLIYLSFFLFFIISSKITNAQNIAVVNIQLLIDNNNKYIDKINELEKSQKKYLEKFKLTEQELNKKFTSIEEAKLILTENEINLQIDDYNNELSNFSILIEEFNFHYQNQVLQIRESVLNEIIILLEKFAIDNKLDLILDSTSYLIASNSIDITEDINKQLKEINLKLEYKDFEIN